MPSAKPSADRVMSKFRPQKHIYIYIWRIKCTENMQQCWKYVGWWNKTLWHLYKIHKFSFKKMDLKIQFASLFHLDFVNTLRPRRNRRHFADDIFKCIFLNENEWISLRISLKFVSNVPINDITSSFQIMAWHWPGDKPLWWLVYRHIHASLSLNELSIFPLLKMNQ